MGNGKIKRKILQAVKMLVEKKRAQNELPLAKFNGEGW